MMALASSSFVRMSRRDESWRHSVWLLAGLAHRDATNDQVTIDAAEAIKVGGRQAARGSRDTVWGPPGSNLVLWVALALDHAKI